MQDSSGWGGEDTDGEGGTRIGRIEADGEEGDKDGED